MTPRPVVALTLTLATLLAGCSRPADEAERGEGPAASSCPDVAEASASAPLLAALQDDPENVARRLAGALGGNVTGPPEALASGEIRWRDGDVLVTIRRGEDEVHASWERAGEWRPTDAEAEATLRRAILAFEPADPEAFNVTLAGPPLRVEAVQTYEGRAIASSGATLAATGTHANVTVSSLRETRPGLDLIPEAQAVDVATRAARCSLDQAGETEEAGHRLLGADPARFDAKGNSLAWVVTVRFSEPPGATPTHCGRAELVHVDAVTGKVLGIGVPGCD